MSKFATLFKKYRLRGEFETISAFGDVLIEKGYFYEESISPIGKSKPSPK